MTITLDLKPEVQSQLAAQAQAHGLAVEAYAQELLERAIGSEAELWDQFDFDVPSPEEAGRDILKLREGVTLGGLNIKDLIHEGHRY